MTRRQIIPILALVILLVVAVATRGFGLIPKPQGPLKLYGNVDIREVDLGFRVGGRIAQMPVEEGAHVKAGQLLAALDPAPIADRAAQARAQVAQAKANLLKLENGSRAQDIEAAKARVANAAAAAADAEADYARRAPLVEPGRDQQGALGRDGRGARQGTGDTVRGQVQSFAGRGRAAQGGYRGRAGGR